MDRTGAVGFLSVILATLVTAIGKIMVPDQPVEKVVETPSQVALCTCFPSYTGG
jgi:hypothetical protein